MNADNLAWLQQWYLSHCNGVGNINMGISIENLQDPGWHLTVDLVGTDLQWREFKELAIERTNEVRVRCKFREQETFLNSRRTVGSKFLSEMIEIFRRWVQA